jgi:catechol 2,3-dioxygenase-like lactoylglutathione lyase family enzyme
MVLNISQLGPTAPPVPDGDRAEAFYEHVLGLRKLCRFGNPTFFDCAGVRPPLEKTSDLDGIKRRGWIEFRRTDIALAIAELGKRGLTFEGNLHLIAKKYDHDLRTLMQEAPKGYSKATIH